MKNISTKTKSAALSTKEFSKVWDTISDDLAAAFRMPEEEKMRFKDKDIAKLIAAIPFLAGCEDAERTAVSHVGIYVLSNRETKLYYNAHFSDNESVFERLRLISSFKGGNPDIIKKGMALIALTMLNDYKRDVYIDETLGKYNPVADNEFDYEGLKKDLETRIRSVKCFEMDEILDEAGTRGFWGH